MSEDNKRPDLESLFAGMSEEEMNKRQWQIIDAAVKVFAEKGYEASKTSEIAREAEVAEGTIFRYFKTKKDLLKGLLLPMVVKFFRPIMLHSVERIINNSEELPIEETFKQIYVDRISLAKKNQALLKTVLIESQHHPELLKPIQEEIAPKIIPLIDELFEKKIREGALKDLEPRLITRTAMSLVMGYLILTGVFSDTFTVSSDEEEAAKMVDILLNGIKKNN